MLLSNRGVASTTWTLGLPLMSMGCCFEFSSHELMLSVAYALGGIS